VKVTTLGAALACAVTTGCASIVNGTTQEVQIRTTPPGARALILPEGETIETPGEVTLRRKLAHTIQFDLEGYCPATTYLDRVTSGWINGNILLGGLIGTAVDAANGAAYRLTPDPVDVELQTAGAPSADGRCRPIGAQ